MAKTLSFYRIGSSENMPDVYLDGAIYFDEVDHVIKVGNGTDTPTVFSGVQSASYADMILTLVNADGTSVAVNFGTLKTSLEGAISAALGDVWDVLGETADDGIRKQISDVESSVGIIDAAVSNLSSAAEAFEDILYGENEEPGLLNKVEEIETSVASLASEIEDLEIPVEGIAEGEKIISLSDKKISSTLKISYDSTEKKIKLLGIGDEQIGDAIDCSDFIADGILESAELVDLEEGDVEGKEAGKYFKFTWNAESGKDPIYVSMESFRVNVYSAGKDLALDSNGKFDVSLDEDIEITGVQVGNLGVEINKLTAGMSLSEILTAMLCKDVDAKVNANPSLTSISGGLPATSYEVGETVPAFTLTTSFKDGSFASSDTTLYPKAKFIENNGSSPLPAGCVVGEYTWSGVDSYDGNTATVDSFEMGTSTKTYSVVASYAASTTVPKTLLKKDSTKSIAAGSTSASSTSVSITSYYKDFYGVIPASNTNVSADNGLTSMDEIELPAGVKHSTSSFTINVNPGDKGVYIWTKSTIKSFMNGSDNFTADLKKTVVNYTKGTQTTAYNLYSFPNTAGYVAATSYVVTLN